MDFKTRRIGVALMVFGLFLLLGAKKEERCEGIPLIWKPTTELGELEPVVLTGLTDIRIEVAGLTDGRDSAELIGENHETGVVNRATTPDDVPAFVSEHIAQLLGDFGFQVVEKDGDVRLSGELRRFFVREENTYEGDVQILIRIEGGEGAIYEALVTGSAGRFGRSYKAENYYETLSDALIESVHRMVTSEAFREALLNGK